jgi:CDP-3, 6-dideoxy-D-glycero-L-glycero-4-hexulose-4-reductase
MKVLVSGATGYVGKNLCESLYASDVEFAVLIRRHSQTTSFSELGIKTYLIDSESPEKDLTAACLDFAPTSIVHAAGAWSNGRMSENLSELVQMNICYSTYLALAALNVEAKFYNLATYWQLSQSKVVTVKNFYTQTKQTFESLLDSLIEHEGLSATSLYLYDNFGPKDSRGKIVDLLLANKGNQIPLKMSDPNKYLNLLYIRDVVDGIISSLKMKTTPRNLEIANNNLITLKKLVEVVEEASKVEIRVEWERDYSVVGDYARHSYQYQQPLNWNPKFTIRDGINERVSRESL